MVSPQQSLDIVASQPNARQKSAAVEFGREVCGSLEIAEQREWLVTNGIGGFASGTVGGNMTRRYHGLLFAALKPPVGRTLLVASVEETLRYDGTDYPLATNRWVGGAVAPSGYRNLEAFFLEGVVPVWRFAVAGCTLEKRIWMKQGENSTFVQYSLERGSGSLQLGLKVLVNYRDFHATTHAGDWHVGVDKSPNGIKVTAFDGATPFYLLSQDAQLEPRHDWYRGYLLPLESYRGLEDSEDHLLAAEAVLELAQGQTVTLVLTTSARAELDGPRGLAHRRKHQEQLLSQWSLGQSASASDAPSWVKQLILAADQFIVERGIPGEPDGKSIIAGYHWFGDWGRDTMIALPGLTLTTGRAEIAKKILLAFSRFVDRGMLPNDFPDAGGTPEYNTVDAALWYIEAARSYFDSTRDLDTLRKLYPVMTQIIEWYERGTRFRIHADREDGLLFAGENGVQLTWMDAKVGDWVVTPRIGKPVEVNALWYNALRSMAHFAATLGKSHELFQKMALRVEQSFSKFWNPAAGGCYDVIESPGTGNDPAMRPNQIFAVSLRESPLSQEQQKSVVDLCARCLLTSHGLRSLSAHDSAYQGHYGGGPRERDGAYHQGTVWGWLMGPFVLAHQRVYGDRETARSFLNPLGSQISSHGLGSLSEIYDGDAPFCPRGCIAQAWTVAEVLRAWHATAA